MSWLCNGMAGMSQEHVSTEIWMKDMASWLGERFSLMIGKLASSPMEGRGKDPKNPKVSVILTQTNNPDMSFRP